MLRVSANTILRRHLWVGVKKGVGCLPPIVRSFLLDLFAFLLVLILWSLFSRDPCQIFMEILTTKCQKIFAKKNIPLTKFEFYMSFLKALALYKSSFYSNSSHGCHLIPIFIRTPCKQLPHSKVHWMRVLRKVKYIIDKNSTKIYTGILKMFAWAIIMNCLPPLLIWITNNLTPFLNL